MTLRLAELTTEALAALLAEKNVIALLPVGSVEPHGPHLPLSTDCIISDAASLRAADRLSTGQRVALVAPGVAYGVTRYAAGFAGAVGVTAEVLTPFLRAVVTAYLAEGFSHVCLVNNHLEPEHDLAVRAAIDGLDPTRASVACPLTRRWARTLSDEYKSGACHAGRYETSLVLAAAPELVHADIARKLPTLDISLSESMRGGLTTFRAMGLERAYTGAPAEASAAEGNDLYDRLATMIVTEVEEALARFPPP